MSRKASVVNPRDGTWLWWLGHPVRYMALGEQTADTYAFSWGSVPVDAGPPPHRHTFQEGFYVLKGCVTFYAGREMVEIPQGGFVNIGSNTAHYLKNNGDAEAELFVIAAPARFDSFQREAGEAIPGPDTKLQPASAADIERMKSAAHKYGIDLNPPASAFEQEPDLKVTLPHEGNAVNAVGDRYRFLVESEHTNGKYAIWDAIVAPGGGPPPHVHSREEEGFIILEGEVTFYADGERHVATPGYFINAPRFGEHRFQNETEKLARMLIMVAPGGLEKMFRRTGDVVNISAPLAPPNDAEKRRLLEIAPEYGIEIKLPH